MLLIIIESIGYQCNYSKTINKTYESKTDTKVFIKEKIMTFTVFSVNPFNAHNHR